MKQAEIYVNDVSSLRRAHSRRMALGYSIHIMENRPARQNVSFDGLLQRLYWKYQC